MVISDKKISSRHVPYYIAGFVSLITFLVFIPALSNEFITWDDDIYAYENIALRSLNWFFLKWAFTDIAAANYWIPVTWLSHALDYALWGLNPAGHHLTNNILHALNTFVVVVLVFRLLEFGRSDSRFTFHDSPFTLLAAGTTGVLFGLHPLHVESVAWISERKDLLCALFFLWSIRTYINYAASRDSGSLNTVGRQAGLTGKKWYLLTFILFFLSLASKPMAITLPFVLLILDWYPFRRIRSLKDLFFISAEKLPFVLLGIVASAAALWGLKTFRALNPMDSVPFVSRLIVASSAPFSYLLKMVMPVNLMPLYPYPRNISLFSLEYLSGLAFIGMITALSILMIKRQRILLAVWGYYLITLLPVAGIFQVGFHATADRYTYLSSLGPFLIAGLVISRGWAKADSAIPKGQLIKLIITAAAVLMIVLMSYLTIQQLAIWKNGIDFWTYVIRKEPERLPVAYNNRGLAYLAEGDIDRAIEDFGRALSLKPDYIDVYLNRGTMYLEKGSLDRAMDDFSRAIELNPGDGNAFVNRSIVSRRMGQKERALDDLNSAIAADPSLAIAYNNRGLTFVETGRVEDAVNDFTKAVSLDPFYSDAYNNRGLLYAQTGQMERAVDDFTSAIKAQPSFADAYNNRGLSYAQSGQLEKAMSDFSAAIKINPSGVEAYNNRGLVFENMGQFERAIEDYTMAIALRPDDSFAFVNRGTAFGRMRKEDEAALDFKKACELGNGEGCEALRTIKKQ